MIENALISYLGENKPNLISEITAYLTDAGGEFSGVTFATLGRVCELTHFPINRIVDPHPKLHTE